MTDVAWLVAVPPALAFVLIAVGFRRSPRLSAWLTVLAIFASFILSVVVFFEVAGGAHADHSRAWLPIPPSAAAGPHALTIGFQVDPLTALMLVVVSSVSLLVQVYSVGYMRGDHGYARYFAAMNLFTMSMLGLVLANNLLAIYIFWELVGLCSYLLIGHWHERPEAAAAAKKAFIVTRVGDFGFLVGILFLFTHTGTLKFTDLAQMAADGRLADPALTLGMLLVFCGAIGKSAQFPLHVWLPDAMEGPTPVSALIHAATMVAAGVYLMARTFPILEHSTSALAVVASIGAFSAFFAATMGLVSRDIKRVLAYSTISQLGYMLLGIGMGAMAAGMFHLFNHAFFKALLFLAAGSVIHLVSTNDMFEMGGLRRWRQVAAVTMLIGSLSLAGIFPLSGFWSKDEILAASTDRPLLFALALATVFLTAFYMFRVLCLTFLGSYRGHARDHPEPPSMTIPLIVLMVPSIFSGVWGAPFLNNPFGTFLGDPHTAPFRPEIAILSNLVALGGIGLAWWMYRAGRIDAAAGMAARCRWFYSWLANRYYMDHLYNWLVRRVVLGFATLATWFDAAVVDGMVNGVGATAIGVGTSLRRAQSGQVQTYAWVLFAGLVTLALVFALPLALRGRV